jgi:non-ribosomal peptide synthase protein (TIGR01720 family)
VDVEAGAAENTWASADCVISEVPAVPGAQTLDMLATAAVVTLAEWMGRPSVLLDITHHDRNLCEDIDLSRTVGRLDVSHPLVFHVERGEPAKGVFERVKEKLRTLPARGLYQSRPIFKPEISLEYRRSTDPISQSKLFAGSTIVSSVPEAVAKRPYLIQIEASVRPGGLHIKWIYSRNIHRASTIEKVAESYVRVLRLLMKHSLEREAEYSPSDFPDIDLSPDDLARIVAEIDPHSQS